MQIPDFFTSSLPLTIRQALEQDSTAVLILLFGTLPASITAICFIIESLFGVILLMSKKKATIKGAFVANLLGIVTLIIGCVAVLSLLTHLNTKTTLPLWTAVLYVLPVVLAITVKWKTFRRYIPRHNTVRLALIFICSHLLALVGLFYIYQHYLP